MTAGDDLDRPPHWGIEDWNGWRAQREPPVAVGNAAGRRFAGTHGRGTLTLPADWPQDDAVGAGMRRSWYSDRGLDLQRTRLSDRLRAADVDPERKPNGGWRGVRTAP